MSDAGLDLTGSGHSSRRVQGLWLARPIESDLVRKRPLACPIESDLVRKRPQNILTSTGLLGRVAFSRTFVFWRFSFDFFFSYARQSFFFFFDHADCGACFLLAKNGIVIVARHSASESSDENAHTEILHLPSAAFLDRFLLSRPGQLPKLKETFLHGHSILHDRLLNEREKNDIETTGMRLANEIFDVILVCDSYSSRFMCFLNLPKVRIR